MASPTNDNRIRLNIPVEFDVSKKLVPAYTGSHFFDENGQYKAYKLKQPKHRYALDDLIAPKASFGVVDAFKKLAEWVRGFIQVEQVCTKRRAGFRTNFYFLKVEARRKTMFIEIKSPNGWQKHSVCNFDQVEGQKTAIVKAYNLSFKPVLKQLK